MKLRQGARCNLESLSSRLSARANQSNQWFALGFNLVYIHDKDWLCSGWSCNAQTSKFVCRLPKPIRTWSPRRFPFGHVSGHVDTWARGRFKIAGYLKYIHMSWPQEKSFIFLGSILAKSRGLQCCDDKISQIRIELINYYYIHIFNKPFPMSWSRLCCFQPNPSLDRHPCSSKQMKTHL